MQLIKALAFIGLLAGGALAAPNAEPNPPKPPKPSPSPPPPQKNACGNNATPYCCNTDNKGNYAYCYVFGKSSLSFSEPAFTRSTGLRDAFIVPKDSFQTMLTNMFPPKTENSNQCSSNTVCCNAVNVSPRSLLANLYDLCH